MDPGKNCRSVGKLLEPFLDGELTTRQEELVKEEIARCEECRHEYERLQKMRVLIREVYVEEARIADLDGIWPGVQEKIRQQPTTLWSSVRNWLDKYRLGLASPVAPLGVAATIGVAVIAATLIYVSNNAPSSLPVVPGGKSTVARTDGEKRDGVQPDRGQKVARIHGRADGKGAAGTESKRRPRHGEKPFKKNECFITYYKVTSGTVLVDVDPDGDSPTVVWHFPDVQPTGEENNRI